MKKLTREERRRRSQRRLQLITYLLFLLLLLAWLGSYLIMTVEAELPAMHKPDPTAEDGSLPGDNTTATTRCYLTGDELIEAALLARSHKLEDVTITFYCCEERPHICGTGSGITASGRRVTPYVSCAVDPDIIPLGSTIMIEHNGGGNRRCDSGGPDAPSLMSRRTTSFTMSFSAMQFAQVAPTFPAPTTVTFISVIFLLLYVS